jgi:hypothetical protein
VGLFYALPPAATSLMVIAAVNLGVRPGCAIGEIKGEQMKMLGLGQFSDCR